MDGVAISEDAVVKTGELVVLANALTVVVESILELFELFELLLSSLLSPRTAPTRSLAILDQDSSLLCASQQAAGPSPLIFLSYTFNFSLFHHILLFFISFW